MGVSWTAEQQQVIELRDRNILVSAAAGSGKTAVLVERIITMITDTKAPVDIDHLLIVTFTNAAAGEMRERIRTAIEKKLEEDNENEHLERQLTLVHQAQITTIHSFCQHVIRNYFHLIDLDPSFRIGDEGELKLLKGEIIEDLIEAYYAKEETRFTDFIECYAPGKSDQEIGKLILQLYDFSMSSPWPIKWLKECCYTYEIESVSELCAAPWMKLLLDQIQSLLTDAAQKVQQALALAREPDGPYMYEEALQSDAALLAELMDADGYLSYSLKFAGALKFTALSRKKDEAVSDAKKEQIKALRDQMKKSLKGIQEQYFYASAEEIANDIHNSKAAMEMLVELTIEFSQQFKEKKREKNLLDFNDLEHLALEILIKEEEGQAVPTDAARQLAEQFEEVMIDEYQDSNLVQEYILGSVSRQQFGKNNVFMVGDVKQSIYRFRLARPELFMEKYDTYSIAESDKQKIELHKNFRSRSEVLDSVNVLFKKIMRKDLGNVEYDDNAALYVGATFPAFTAEQEPVDNKAEVILLDLDAEAEAVAEAYQDEDKAEATAIELEARMIGSRIKQMVDKAWVQDKQTGQYRTARYSDIVILLRTISGWADTFSTVLNEMAIPAFTGSQSGYFSAVEVQTVLALLKVIDNPKQDIPLAAVLHSPICGLSDEEMAKIKSSYPDQTFEAACLQYHGMEKLDRFFELLKDIRSRVPYTTIHELLWYIFKKTGYADYVSAMPDGAQRAANLNMLLEKAMAYESTSYRGLFNFVRYIEQLKKYDIDFGEANILGEEEDTVRIMSIHKSKGLEFPIVFAAGMHKRFNQQDSRSKLALHADLGIGCDFIDPVLRIKAPTLIKKLIQRQTVYENLGEELRVLYVALTRAKEKLILTGVVSKMEDKMQKWNNNLSFSDRAAAGCYLDWIMPALKGAEEELFAVKLCDMKDIAVAEAEKQLARLWSREQLLNWDTEQSYDLAARDRLEKAMQFHYPFEDSEEIYGKITVSELKTLQQSVDADDDYSMYQEPQVVPLIPNFIEEREVTGAALGTIYHRFLECLDYTSDVSAAAVKGQLQAVVKSGKLQETEAKQIKTVKILAFLQSDIGRRMRLAAEQNQLFREQQFVMGTPAKKIRENWTSEDMVLIQGIIDAYFYEGEDIILVDYKTDYVPGNDESFLIEKYGVQLNYYAEALERMTGKRVKEQIIYSFWLQKGLRNM